jgi:hypothetical protein
VPILRPYENALVACHRVEEVPALGAKAP